jgi:hypothetical protein
MERTPLRAQHACARSNRIRNRVLLVAFAAALSAGCTRIELEHKAESYNAAIADSTNESILLNAVRASQRAPMSFTGLGDVVTSPIVSGGAEGTFGFDPLGLTSYSLKPSVSVGGGFNTFNMSNLNRDKFIKNIQKPVDRRLIAYFEALSWPTELLQLMFVSNYTLTRDALLRIERNARSGCEDRRSPRTMALCRVLDENRAEYAARCSGGEYAELPPVVKLLNTGRDYCDMAKFQIFLRMIRLLRIKPFQTPYLQYTTRSAQGMLYFLGELIAAQNYSTRPYTPTILIGTAEGRLPVPLFVVLRGLAAPGQAAVRVNYRGDTFFIPQPELGTATEARSLQVLDIVMQVIALQTTEGDLPKTNTIGLIAAR